MPRVETILSEVLKQIPRYHFQKAVERYEGDRYIKKFSTWQQFTTIFYSHIKQKDSLRDIETGLAAQSSRLYHLGIDRICRSTLSDANNRRDYRIFEHVFYKLLEQCRDYTPKHKFRFKNPLYALDASVIDLCLSVFPWAKFRQTKGAIKLHCLYDHSGAMPSFVTITDGKKHDVRVAKESAFPLSPDSIVSMDRAYIDYQWLYTLDQKRVWYVTRTKSNMQYRLTGQHPVTGKGVLADHRIQLTGFYAVKHYPKELRRIEFYDAETKKRLTFLTNNFSLAASTIAQIYKSRWQIELFFKWIKQNLKIKSFLGTSRNAVLSQIWIAMCYYLMLTYIKYQTKYAHSLLTLSRLIRATLLDRKTIIDILSLHPERLPVPRYEPRQGTLF